MTVEELVKEEYKLADELGALLTKFTEKTNIVINHISIDPSENGYCVHINLIL